MPNTNPFGNRGWTLVAEEDLERGLYLTGIVHHVLGCRGQRGDGQWNLRLGHADEIIDHPKCDSCNDMLNALTDRMTAEVAGRLTPAMAD